MKQRVRRDAEKNGFTLHICGSFGFKSGPKSTDNPRDGRVLRQKMPGEVARRLFAARDAGAGQAEQEEILAEALGEHCFRQGGRARGLEVAPNDVAWMDLEL
ncbi:hypothetical protein SAMN05216371_0260 [Streptomyces sp. TLI_053]|uniref:hypothetical protein n=1 Tax=Streptomyces sp. TLI_053 TaxID=1855352 RepID=UPI00087CF770|nr:hypothetical protein [Streptomyces sp. TLI_053]SDS60983.1 hypothetical protein SAMN05216371_0260 [Streptomyces sp. TLI_053]